MASSPLYLDYNATTPVDPRVFEAMRPYFLEKFGNAASPHLYGWAASNAVDQARETLAKALNADGHRIVFTSGATESNNMVIQGLARASAGPIHIITQKTEHSSVLEPCHALEKDGHEVTYLDVDPDGFVNPADIQKSIKPNTVLCSIMAANNEIGTLQPISEISQLCRDNKILFHTDAVQAFGKIPLDVKKTPIDFLSLSGHKMYGPKGIGALVSSPQALRHRLAPLLYGGGHEQGHRSGTLNVPGIVGLSEALKICLQEMETESIRLTTLRNRFLAKVFKNVDDVILNGAQEKRLPNNINLSFRYIKSEDLLRALPQLALSSGAACASGSSEPSSVMKALCGSDKDPMESSQRLGLGRWTTEEEVDRAAHEITEAVRTLRSRSLAYEMAQKKKD